MDGVRGPCSRQYKQTISQARSYLKEIDLDNPYPKCCRGGFSGEQR